MPLQGTTSSESPPKVLRKSAEYLRKPPLPRNCTQPATQQAAGKSDLLQLVSAVATACAAIPDEDTQAQLLELRQTVDALAAACQLTAVTPRQLQALVAMKDCRLVLAQALAPVLEDPWWRAQFHQVWQTAAVEGIAQPQMASIVRTCHDRAATQQEIEQAWGTAMAKLGRWRRETRAGCTNEIEGALESWLKERVPAAAAAQAEEQGADAATEWIKRAEQLRSWVTWFRSNCKPEALEAELAELTAALATAGAAQKLEAGLVEARQLLTDPTCEEVAQRMLAVFSACRGARPAAGARDLLQSALAALKEYGEVAMTAARADLAILLLDLLGGPGLADSQADAESDARLADSQADARSWQKTVHGFALLALVEGLGSLKPQDPAARLSIMEALQQWDSWGETAVVGDVGSKMEEAAGRLRQWQAGAKAQVQGAAVAAATKAVEALEARAKGGQGGQSWRQALPDDATWEHIERESSYHLFPPASPPQRRS